MAVEFKWNTKNIDVSGFEKLLGRPIRTKEDVREALKLKNILIRQQIEAKLLKKRKFLMRRALVVTGLTLALIIVAGVTSVLGHINVNTNYRFNCQAIHEGAVFSKVIEQYTSAGYTLYALENQRDFVLKPTDPRLESKLRSSCIVRVDHDRVLAVKRIKN